LGCQDVIAKESKINGNWHAKCLHAANIATSLAGPAPDLKADSKLQGGNAGLTCRPAVGKSEESRIFGRFEGKAWTRLDILMAILQLDKLPLLNYNRGQFNRFSIGGGLFRNCLALFVKDDGLFPLPTTAPGCAGPVTTVRLETKKYRSAMIKSPF
jgi:hypothetical protein